MAKGEKISQTIAELEQAFIDRFRELKRGERMLDFTDMEQYAYDILNQDTSNGALAREYYQNRFKEIMVDEYQDTNALQDGLIARLKRAVKTTSSCLGTSSSPFTASGKRSQACLLPNIANMGQTIVARKADCFPRKLPVKSASN